MSKPKRCGKCTQRPEWVACGVGAGGCIEGAFVDDCKVSEDEGGGTAGTVGGGGQTAVSTRSASR